jgi:phosphoribosyl 1,2-cyclic phosphate phosphodiesterase
MDANRSNNGNRHGGNGHGMTYRFTFMGTGSSGGVPRIGHQWGAADRSNPKNRRRRCSALIERTSHKGTTTLLIDTPCDLREQCLTHDVMHVDAVLYTHDHADHTHGIDDLRVFALQTRRRVPVWMDDPTWDSLLVRFRYCFETKPGSAYPPILERYQIVPGRSFTITGAGGPIAVLPILQEHGEMTSLGFRVGGLCYSPDIAGVPAASENFLADLDLWIVDALRPLPHPAHWSVKQSLKAIEHFQPKRALLTHMHVDLDYEALCRDLPETVRPAYDGLKFEFDGTPTKTWASKNEQC